MSHRWAFWLFSLLVPSRLLFLINFLLDMDSFVLQPKPAHQLVCSQTKVHVQVPKVSAPHETGKRLSSLTPEKTGGEQRGCYAAAAAGTDF